MFKHLYLECFCYLGITGPVHIDELGERKMDYSVYDLQESGNSTLFIPVLNFDNYRRTLRYFCLYIFHKYSVI